MKLVEITDQAQWDAYVGASQWGHPLQLWGWGESKRANGWTPYRLALVRGEAWVGAVQLVLWRIPRSNRYIAYAPRGPVADPADKLTRELMELAAAWAKAHGAIYLRMEPAWRIPAIHWPGWKRARHHIQMAATYVIDLRQEEAEVLAAMSHKHRQYIRKAERDGVLVERLAAGDIGDAYDVYIDTAARAGFGIHDKHYYAKLSSEFGEHGYLYQAKSEGKAVAFLWLGAAGTTAYELYGGVTSIGQDMKANYFLKWRAIMEMKAAGFEIYDFNGRITEGVSRFKEGFGPNEVDYVGTWDRPIAPAAYAAWERLWPIVKRAGRWLRAR